jgi:hypothetical protein
VRTSLLPRLPTLAAATTILTDTNLSPTHPTKAMAHNDKAGGNGGGALHCCN